MSGMPAIRETGPGKNLQAITVSTLEQPRAASDTHCTMPQRHKKSMALNIFSAPFLLMRGKEIPTQTFSFSVRMRPEQDDRA
ncbi:hypothetical protein FN958_07900 [Escherichia coli]|nr:hypothetical protein BEN53_14760 [Escherichia coli]QEJ90336.1 hypothetical protein FN958_07900 [Escherichia coli]TEW48966.1 hypothetical protein E2114_09690 [Escherichia coli]